MAPREKPENPHRAGAANAEEHPVGIFAVLREWGDALVIAFVLAMFVRVFVVELFKIPTGSMTPTLIGDYVAEVDLNKDGLPDLVVEGASRTLVWLNRGDRYEVDDTIQISPRETAQWRREGILKPEYDRILVNKFAYWMGQPKRGDVVVFKVPPEIWDPAKPIYIKRAVGLPGETITFDGKLEVAGKPVTNPEFFQHQDYKNTATTAGGFFEKSYVKYTRQGFSNVTLDEVHVPEDGLWVMGDNTRSSLDSRYWGVVPLANLKGKAFMRYWPLNKIKFIH